MIRNRTLPWEINNSEAVAKGNSQKRKSPAESVATISFFIGNFQSNYEVERVVETCLDLSPVVQKVSLFWDAS